jgi:Mg-chelatase subunit ChlD
MNKTQHILFILDRSGSMSSRATDVIGGFNTFVSEMKSEQEQDGLNTRVSLVTFSDNHEVVFASKSVSDVEPLTRQLYRTMGSTALLDTVYDSVTKYRERLGQGVFAGDPDAETEPVLVIVFTDGQENASKKVSWTQVQNLLSECERLGNWTFTYVGAHPDSWSQADQMSVKRGNVLDATDLTVAQATGKLIESSKRHRADYRDLNKKASLNFFSSDDAEPNEGAEESHANR